MAYFNNCTLSTSDEFNAYPNQIPASEQAQSDTLANGWRVGRLPSYVVDEPTNLGAETNLEPVPPAQNHGYDPLAYPEDYWPVTGQYAQSYRSSISRDNSFASTVASEASTATSTLSSIPLDYWGDSASGLSTNMFYANVQTPYQPSTGSTRTGTVQTWRPYETFRPHSNEHTNAEAGLSNLAPPLVPYTDPPSINTSRGISETTAGAENNPKEDVAPTTKKPRARGLAPPRNWRIQYQKNIHRLRTWAQSLEGREKPPAHERALRTALKVIQAKGPVPVYDTHRLAKGAGKRSAQGEKAPDMEHRRRVVTRGLNEELSKYYRLAMNKPAWKCPELLSKVLDHVEELSKSLDVPPT